MAEVDKEGQTEAPTQKKLDDARKRGQVATSAETKHGAMFGAMLLGLGLLGTAGVHLMTMLASTIETSYAVHIGSNTASGLVASALGLIAVALLPVLALLAGGAVAGGLLQGRPSLSWSRVAPRFSKLNPASNLRRMLGLSELLKTLAKFGVVLVACVLILSPSLAVLETAALITPGELMFLAYTLLWKLLVTITIIVVVIAAADNVYQRIAFLRRMRMTKQEIKDEFKEAEGDPHIKSRVRQIQRERSRTRMMAAVPNASVIITNPTHYAVALAYVHGKHSAPRVVAKGVDELAARIRDVASQHGVPLYAQPSLARALYAGVKIDDEVPHEHFLAVAEVISYVMKLKVRRPS